MTVDSQAGHASHTVLVVEDNVDARHSLALLLECEGLTVATVANGLEALHIMRTLRLRPCAVVVDLIMPVMDGLTMGRHMADDAELATIPLVGLSGHEGLRRHALTEGFVAAFLKPGSIDDIVATIGEHCSSSSTEAVESTRRRRA